MAQGKDIRGLAEEWNRLGRDYLTGMSAYMKAQYEGRDGDPRPGRDPRGEAMARAVLAHVQQLNAEHRWREARATFDAADAPFWPIIRKAGRSLPCATILGPDEFLVRIGPSFKAGRRRCSSPGGPRWRGLRPGRLA